MSFLRNIRHWASKKQLRVPLIWLRHRGLDTNDVFLASYPRSGNTWVRFILSEILTHGVTHFDNVDQVIPEMGIHGQARPLLPGGGRLIKTHEPYRKEYRRAIYLVRDMRDCLLSQYSREKELGTVNAPDLDGYLQQFLAGRTTGFGPWHKHVRCWLESPLAQCGDLLVVRFEDMRHNTHDTVVQMLEFLGVSADFHMIQGAIANNTVEGMRKKEDTARKLRQSSREEGRFVRKGAVGGWREKLTDHQRGLIDECAGSILSYMGY
jgi:Sulfotransferase domain